MNSPFNHQIYIFDPTIDKNQLHPESIPRIIRVMNIIHDTRREVIVVGISSRNISHLLYVLRCPGPPGVQFACEIR